MILLLEDDANIREVMTEIISEKGKKVQAVDSVEKALTAINTERPEALILDWYVKDSTCESVLEKSRQLWPDLKTVIMTAGNMTKIEEIRNRLKVHVIPKPFPLEVLEDFLG